MTDPLTLETFAPHVGSTFALRGPPTALDLELVDVAALGTDPADRGRRPFSLEFDGPADPRLAQATVELTHAALGTLAVFVVPIGRDGRHTRYQAIFT
jgi:hypothetical protein